MPCDYSWRMSGTEIVQADAVATVSTTALPIFGNLMRFSSSPNSYASVGVPTVFSDQLTSPGQSVPLSAATATTPAIAPVLAAGPRCAFFDANGNFYYTQGTNTKGPVYKRAGGLGGAETTLFGGGAVWFMALDVESGIIYAATSATTLKRYNTSTSTQLSDVTIASVPLSGTYSSFAVRGGLIMWWSYNQSNIYFSNATTGALLGNLRYDSDNSGSVTAAVTGSPFITKTSGGVYKAYFGYCNNNSDTGNGEAGLACITCGTAPLATWAPTRVNRTGDAFYSVAYYPQSQLWAELPYTNSVTQDLVLAMETDAGTNKAIWLFNKLTDTLAYKFTVPSIPNGGGALIALGSPAQATADFGTVRCKISGIKIK